MVEEHKVEHYNNCPPTHPKFWVSLGMAVLLIMIAAVCSGMTVGYLSIDEMQLEIKLAYFQSLGSTTCFYAHY